ncbi:MAG: hypothetical protein QM701_01700 [Propionivibrio sp.]
MRNTVELRAAGEADGLQVRQHLDLHARGEIPAQDLQRRAQPEVVQRQRPKVLDDAPLQRDDRIERLGQVPQAAGQIGGGGRQLRAHARHVQLGRRQQRAEFVMQLAGQMRAFVLARQLQVRGQFRQLGGAPAHLHFELVAFGLDRQLLGDTMLVEQAALAPEAHQQQHDDHGHRADADAVQRQRVEDAAEMRVEQPGLQFLQLAGVGADAVHLAQAEAGEDHRPRLIQPLLLDQRQHAGELVELLVDVVFEALAQAQRRLQFEFGIDPAQGGQRGARVGGGRLIGPHVLAPAGDDVAALRGFGVGDALHEPLQRETRGAHLDEFVQAPVRAAVCQLVDRNRQTGHDEGEYEEDPFPLETTFCLYHRLSHRLHFTA